MLRIFNIRLWYVWLRYGFYYFLLGWVAYPLLFSLSAISTAVHYNPSDVEKIQQTPTYPAWYPSLWKTALVLPAFQWINQFNLTQYFIISTLVNWLGVVASRVMGYIGNSKLSAINAAGDFNGGIVHWPQAMNHLARGIASPTGAGVDGASTTTSTPTPPVATLTKNGRLPSRERFNTTPVDVLMAYLAALAYEYDETVREVVSEWQHAFPNQSLKYLQAYTFTAMDPRQAAVTYNTRCYAFITNDALIISFRGTQPFSLLEWLCDAHAELISFPVDTTPGLNVNLHNGFAASIGLTRAWEEKKALGHTSEGGTGVTDAIPEEEKADQCRHRPLISRLARLIRGYQKADKKIYITGHSLGAALAAMAAFGLKAVWNIQADGVFTFGQPRVGDPLLQAYMEHVFPLSLDTFRRFVNLNDVVPRFLPGPNDPFALEYFHFGQERYLAQDGAAYLCRYKPWVGSIGQDIQPYTVWNLPYWARNVMGIKPCTFLRRALWLILPPEINDHMPLDYVSKIRDNVRYT